MNDVTDEIKNQHASTKAVTPPVVTGARFFLVVCIITWSVGVVAGVIAIWRNLGVESVSLPFPSLIAVLVWRSTLLGVALVAFQAIKRKKAAGRWLTVALAIFAGYLSILRVARLWNAARGDYRAANEYFAYNSSHEVNGALAVAVLIVAGLAVLVRQLVVGRNAIEYFEH